MLTFLFTKTPLLYFVQSFWRDEAFTYVLAKRNIFDILVLTAKDFNPPLYYLIIHYWMKLFGTSEIILRLFSVIMYCGVLYASYLFLIHIFKISTKKSYIYLLLIALNPILLYYAFEARMYTMLAFLATLSFYAFWKNNYKTYFITTILGLFTHYFMLFVVIAQVGFYILVNKKKLDKKIVLKYLAPMAFFIPWFLFVLNVKNVGSESFWIAPIHINTFIRLFGIIFTGYEMDFGFFEKIITVLSLFLVLFTVMGIVYHHKKQHADRKMLWYLVLWSIGTPLLVMAVSFIKPIFLPRYIIFSTVGLLLLFIYILESLPPMLCKGIMALLLVITLVYNGGQIVARRKSNMRQLIGQIKYLANKNDVLYVTNELDYFTAQYYFGESRVYIYGKQYEVVPDFVGKVLMPKYRFISTLPRYPRKAFILTSDSHYDIQAAQ